MEVKVMSVFDAFEYVLDHYAPVGLEEMAMEQDTYAIISIQDSHTDGFGLRFCENRYCKAALTLLFDDVEDEVEGAIAFNEEMAKSIVGFIDNVKDEVDTLLVHCYAGQSRSRAVGAFAKFMLGQDNTELAEYGSPNGLVYRLLMDSYKNCREER